VAADANNDSSSASGEDALKEFCRIEKWHLWFVRFENFASLRCGLIAVFITASPLNATPSNRGGRNEKKQSRSE
jgi:hypothetical protein